MSEKLLEVYNKAAAENNLELMLDTLGLALAYEINFIENKGK